MSLSRRQLIRNSVITAAYLPFLGCGSNTAGEPGTEVGGDVDNDETMASSLPYLETIGLQLWSVRDQLERDPRITLQTLAEMGYRQVELMDTTSAAELVPIAREYGLAVNSSFINWNTITGGWQYMPNPDDKMEFAEVIDQAGEAGLSHLIFGYLNPQERETADQWKAIADQGNEAARVAQENGLQMAYHNHNFEWDPVEGTTGWAILEERFDPELMPFELDVFWAQIAGQDPRPIMARNAERIELLHLKQLKPGTPVVTRLADVPPDAFEELPQGNIPIKDLMRYGQNLGVRYCMVEQDGNYEGSSLASVRQSLEFLAG